MYYRFQAGGGLPTLLLGSGADVDRRTVAGIHRREERAFEIRQRDLFTTESGRLFYRARLGVYVCFFSSRCRCSGCRFRGVFLGSVRICLFRVGNPASEVVAEVFRNFGKRCSGADSYPRQRVASCTFVCRKVFRHTKVQLALRGRVAFPSHAT